MNRFSVHGSSGSYEILVGIDVLHHLRGVVQTISPERVLIVADRAVAAMHGTDLESLIGDLATVHRVDIDIDETRKSLGVAGEVLERMARAGFRKSDAVLTLGGGVVSDLGGFVASVYARGVKVIHVPTTLLGQVDAAIGGKTGVNLPSAKNLVGTFHQPSAVIADIGLLSTLPSEQWRSGMAEVIKYGLCFKPDMIRALSEADEIRNDLAFVEQLISECVQIKADVVSADERDESGRLILNYGHTLGHALEFASGYRMAHGNAISVGMVFASRLSVASGLADADLVDLHLGALAHQGLPVDCSFDPVLVRAAWSLDKKNTNRQRWILLSAPGHPVVREDVPEKLTEEVLETVRSS